MRARNGLTVLRDLKSVDDYTLKRKTIRQHPLKGDVLVLRRSERGICAL